MILKVKAFDLRQKLMIILAFILLNCNSKVLPAFFIGALIKRGWYSEEYDIGNELTLTIFKSHRTYIKCDIYTIDFNGKVIEYQVKYDSYEHIYREEFYPLIEVETISEYGSLSYLKWN